MSSLSGFGLGLRREHYEAVLSGHYAIDWFEVVTENYLVPGGRPLHYLERIRAQYPVAMHGVSLSIGSSAPLDRRYLRELHGAALWAATLLRQWTERRWIIAVTDLRAQ